MRVSVKDKIRHMLNPLHVYCSLSYVLRKRNALKTARMYESRIYTPFIRSLL